MWGTGIHRYCADHKHIKFSIYIYRLAGYHRSSSITQPCSGAALSVEEAFLALHALDFVPMSNGDMASSHFTSWTLKFL